MESKIDRLLKKMSLQDKIGQMSQRNEADSNYDGVKSGKIGSILNEADPKKIKKLQQYKESLIQNEAKVETSKKEFKELEEKKRKID